ncbi:hypothetical protein BDZ97DRAFT_1851166, partial [Flammula alnicola]
MQILMQNGSSIAIKYITEQEVMQNLYNILTKSSPPPPQPKNTNLTSSSINGTRARPCIQGQTAPPLALMAGSSI